MVQSLRNRGVAAELYPDAVKMDKQFKYAEKKAIPHIAILGSRELEAGVCNIKNLASGEQQSVSMNAVKDFLF